MDSTSAANKNPIPQRAMMRVHPPGEVSQSVKNCSIEAIAATGPTKAKPAVIGTANGNSDSVPKVKPINKIPTSG
jgi:hypothetical protein